MKILHEARQWRAIFHSNQYCGSRDVSGARIRIFPFRISDPQQRISVWLTLKIVTKLAEILSSRIPIPDPEVKKHWIPDPQHCSKPELAWALSLAPASPAPRLWPSSRGCTPAPAPDQTKLYCTSGFKFIKVGKSETNSKGADAYVQKWVVSFYQKILPFKKPF